MVESIVRNDPNGDKAFKKGKKAISTSLFKWSADWFEGSIQFEKAAKSYQVNGLEEKASEAWLEYAKCCEKSSDMTGAAEGMQQAAFNCSDFDQSVNLLKSADEYYKIGGYNDRGLTLMKKFAKSMLDKETPEATAKAFKLYE